MRKSIDQSKKFTKTEKSWIMYDWANSVYATNILAVIFPIYFGAVCQSAGADNLVLWSVGTSISTFVVAVLAPVLGALGDHKGHKKKLFTAFLGVGVAFTLTSALFSEYRMLLLGYVLNRCDHQRAHGPGVVLGICYGVHWGKHYTVYNINCDTIYNGHGEYAGV